MTDNALRWYDAVQLDDLLEEPTAEVAAQHKKFCLTHSRTTHTVGDLVLRTLANWGIKQVFGVSEHSSYGLTDSLSSQPTTNINYYSVHYEEAAAFATSAYGKLTGRPAACLANGGSGASNLLHSLWDAYTDRTPVVALTGSVEDTQSIVASAFQNNDPICVSSKVAQWSQALRHDSSHAGLANLACKSAILNRGISHLIIPDEISKRLLVGPIQAGSPEGRLPSQSISPPEDALEHAINLLRASERPVIVVGHGARDRMKAVIQLAEQLRAPIITTLKGKGLISDSHPLAGGVLDRSGTPVADWLMNKSDALLVFGASFNHHTGITDKLPTVQVDYNLTALARFHAIDVPVWGEIGVTAQALSDDFLGDMWTKDQTADIASRWAIWREEKKRCTLDDRSKGIINAAILFEALSDTANDDAIIAVDVGSNTSSFGRYFECKQQDILMSGHPGSIGFAFPAAMGAWSVTQENDVKFTGRQVISISGDGDGDGDGNFGQYLADMNTAVKYNMNITHIMMSDGELSKISEQTNLHSSSFADYANRCGAMGIKVTKTSELEAALKQALNYPGPALLEVITEVEDTN